MKKLLDKDIFYIVSLFDIDLNLTFEKYIDFEPDCKIYILKNDLDDKFALICRDLEVQDFEAEKRILKEELNITIVDRIKSKNDYFVHLNDFDEFEYVFSLNMIL